jgi:hypothetical protein
MRVLLDESLPHRLKSHLPGHEVRSVGEVGWAGRKNGDLLRGAAGLFDVFVTTDRHLPEQQKLAGLEFAIVILIARSNDIADLEPLMSDLRDLLPTLTAAQLVRLGG